MPGAPAALGELLLRHEPRPPWQDRPARSRRRSRPRSAPCRRCPRRGPGRRDIQWATCSSVQRPRCTSLSSSARLILDARHPRGGMRVGLLLFLDACAGRGRWRSPECGHPARACQSASIVVGRLQRGIHLDQRPQPRVVVDVEQQVMRTRLGGDQPLMVAQQIRLVARRNMQHVETVFVPRPPDRGRGGSRSWPPAASRIREWSAGSAPRPRPGRVGADRRLVFAVGGDRQRRLGEDPFQRLLVVDQQTPGAGADERS